MRSSDEKVPSWRRNAFPVRRFAVMKTRRPITPAQAATRLTSTAAMWVSRLVGKQSGGSSPTSSPIIEADAVLLPEPYGFINQLVPPMWCRYIGDRSGVPQRRARMIMCDGPCGVPRGELMSELRVDPGVTGADATEGVRRAGEAFRRVGEAFNGVHLAAAAAVAAGLGQAVRAAAEAELKEIRDAATKITPESP